MSCPTLQSADLRHLHLHLHLLLLLHLLLYLLLLHQLFFRHVQPRVVGDVSKWMRRRMCRHGAVDVDD